MWRSLVGAGALVEHDGRILMILRHRSGKLRWELPSGLIEAHESLEQTAAREILEETAIPIEVGSLLCTVVMEVPDEEYRGINTYYRATPTRILKPVPGDDEPIEKAEFIDVCKIATKDIHPVDRKILAHCRHLHNTRPFYFRILL